MKSRILSIAVVSLIALGFATPAEAAKKGKKGDRGSARVLSRLDRDHNGTIDGKEAAHAQAIFAALAKLDTNKDGTLSESELASAKVPAGKSGKGGKKKKKSQ